VVKGWPLVFSTELALRWPADRILLRTNTGMVNSTIAWALPKKEAQRTEEAMKQNKGVNIRDIPAPDRKISEMVWKFAADFIRVGDTLEERQNRLNAAVSAWNIAARSSNDQRRMLDQYFESYKAYNPHTGSEDLAAMRRDMETLIQNKLRLFPHVRNQIVGAQITQVGGQDRINVVSVRAG